MPDSTLPHDLALLARIVDAQPPDVQVLFQYGMTMLLIEERKTVGSAGAAWSGAARSTAASG